MCKHVFLAGFILVTFNLHAWGQTGDEDARKQALKLAESLKGKFPNQQVYLKLMAMKPIPKEIEPTLRKVIATEPGDTGAVAAALLVEIVPDAKLVKPLAGGLASKNAFVGAAAMKALVKLGPPAKSALPEYLIAMDTAPLPVRGAGVALAEIMGKDAILPLEQILMKSTPKKQNDHAAKALGKIGSEAVPTILKLLNMDDPLMDIYAGKALKAMEKKPYEAFKPMQRFAKHKDAEARRLYYEYLAALSPATDAVNAALMEGLQGDSLVTRICLDALRTRTTDKAKWAAILKGRLDRGEYMFFYELHAIDPAMSKSYLPGIISQSLSGMNIQLRAIGQLSTLDNELKPYLPIVYKNLDGPAKGNVTSRLSSITLLTFLPPEHTKPVVAKLETDLKHTRWEVKLAAAEALLRTNPKNKTSIAKAMAEVLSNPKLPYDFPYERVINDIKAMGPDTKAAVPTLRIAQTKAKADVKARILLLMATLDPGQKEFAVSTAQMMRQSANDSYAGVAVLLQLGAISSDEAMKELNQGLDTVRTLPYAMFAVEILGPKATPLLPKLEAKLSDPKILNPLNLIVTLRKVDGNSKVMLERLVNHAREFPKDNTNVGVICNRIGAEVRPILPELVEIMGNERILAPEFVDAIARIDPKLIRLLPN